MAYVMSPQRYQALSQVSGFCALNGNTYADHLVFWFAENLTAEQRTNVLQHRDNPGEALRVVVAALESPVTHTHPDELP